MAPKSTASSHSDAGMASGSCSPREDGAPSEACSRKRKRVERPEIDLDNNIREAKATIQRAQAALSQARQQAKADRRKKARLIRKACHLSPADLERIAVLKRCGLAGGEPGDRMPQDQPSGGSAAARPGSSHAEDAGNSGGSARPGATENATAGPVPATPVGEAARGSEDVEPAGEAAVASAMSDDAADSQL